MYSNEQIRNRAQALRSNMTREERHLWYDYLKTYPIQFKRQYSFGAYIVDFYCYQAKLIVELDGAQHCEPEQIIYDQNRTAYLERQGFCVIRISNTDVMQRFSAVCEAIDSAVKDRLKQG